MNVPNRRYLAEVPKEQMGGIPYKGRMCSIEGKQIITHLTMALRRHLNGAPILNHWFTNQHSHDGLALDIDWQMMARAVYTLPRAKQ